MLRPAPEFPALDVWQKMDEAEQDALIARIEAARRRAAMGLRVLMVLGCAAAAAGLGLALLAALA